MKTGFNVINNTRLHYEVTGKGEPVFLLHSGIADLRMWVKQLHGLSKYFQVITPDFRGYGKSTVPNGPFHHYEDTYSLIRHLGFKTVNVVGCSLGGMTALELAVVYPEAIDHLILIAPGIRGYEYQDKETLDIDSRLEKLVLNGTREAVADMLVDIWVIGLKRKQGAVALSTRSLVRKMILDNYDSVIDKYPEAEKQFNLLSRLGEIVAPTLVLIGDSDLPDMVTISKLVADKIPGARRKVIRNAAHLPNLEHSRLVNQSIINFLV